MDFELGLAGDGQALFQKGVELSTVAEPNYQDASYQSSAGLP